MPDGKEQLESMLEASGMSKEQFEKDLDDCLTIINYPSRTRKYYVCEHISPALLRRKVKVFVNR